MKRVLQSDWIKIRRTWIPILVLLGPFGVVSLTAMRYAASYPNIVKPGDDTLNWALLLQNISHLLMPSLALGITLLASLTAGMEHQGHAWKQLLALPVSRTRIYASKFVWLAALLAVAATLCAVGVIALGWACGFTMHVPWLAVLRQCYYPYLSAYGLIALQLLVSVRLENQSFAITLGVLGVIVSVYGDALAPDAYTSAWPWARFIPWLYPPLSAYTHGAVQFPDSRYVICGFAACIVLLLLGARLFAGREVK